MNRHGYDMPNGIIIGDIYMTGTLHRYDNGVQQSPQFIGDTDKEIVEQAKDWYNENEGKRLWPEGLELRIRG
jgi:hypothetical protein